MVASPAASFPSALYLFYRIINNVCVPSSRFFSSPPCFRMLRKPLTAQSHQCVLWRRHASVYGIGPPHRRHQIFISHPPTVLAQGPKRLTCLQGALHCRDLLFIFPAHAFGVFDVLTVYNFLLVATFCFPADVPTVGSVGLRSLLGSCFSSFEATGSKLSPFQYGKPDLFCQRGKQSAVLFRIRPTIRCLCALQFCRRTGAQTDSSVT